MPDSNWFGLGVLGIFALGVVVYVFWTKRRKVTDHNEIIEYFSLYVAESFNAAEIRSEKKLRFNKNAIGTALLIEALSSDQDIADAAKACFVCLANFQSLPVGVSTVRIDASFRLQNESSEHWPDMQRVLDMYYREVKDRGEIIERLKARDAQASVDTKFDSVDEPSRVPSQEELERWEVVWLRGSVPPQSVDTRNLLRKGNFVMLSSGVGGVIDGFLDRARTELLLKLPHEGMKYAIYPRDVQYIRISPLSKELVSSNSGDTAS